MSHIDSGPLSTYNSLNDKHLAGYFSNSKMRQHLRHSGLITRRGDIISENQYRVNMAKKEHKKHVKDLLAQAIVHKTLDMERMRQVAIRKTLEKTAKAELVRRVRDREKLFSPLDIYPFLSKKDIDKTLREVLGVHKTKSHSTQTDISLISLDQNERRRTGDEDVLPYLSPRPNSASQRPRTSPGRGRPRDPYQRPDARLGFQEHPDYSNSYTHDDEEEPPRMSSPRHPIYIDADGEPMSPRDSKYPPDEIDSRLLFGLDNVALQEYTVALEDSRKGKGIGSPYTQSQLPDDSKVPCPPRMTRSSLSAGPRRRTRPMKQRGTLHRQEPPMAHPSRLQSLCEVTIRYHGENLHLAREILGDPRHEVIVEQQHCGGNTLIVYKDLIMPGTDFTFLSRRHRGYPFSLTLYANGVMNARLSTCCEFKHTPGCKIGGKQGHFGLISVKGGCGPCYKCQVAKQVKESEKKKKTKPEKEEKAEPAEEESKEEEEEETIVCPVQDEEDYGDDFDDTDTDADSTAKTESETKVEVLSTTDERSEDQSEAETTEKADDGSDKAVKVVESNTDDEEAAEIPDDDDEKDTDIVVSPRDSESVADVVEDEDEKKEDKAPVTVVTPVAMVTALTEESAEEVAEDAASEKTESETVEKKKKDYEDDFDDDDDDDVDDDKSSKKDDDKDDGEGGASGRGGGSATDDVSDDDSVPEEPAEEDKGGDKKGKAAGGEEDKDEPVTSPEPETEKSSDKDVSADIHASDDEPVESVAESEPEEIPKDAAVVTVTSPTPEEVTSPTESEPASGVTSPRESVTSPRESVTSPRESVTSPRESVTSPRESVTSPRKSTPASPPGSPVATPHEASPEPITSAREETPIASPREGTPVTSPRDETPVASPHEETPVTSPHDETRVTSPRDDTPVTSPQEETPVVTSPREETPVTSPRESSPEPPKENEADAEADDESGAVSDADDETTDFDADAELDYTTTDTEHRTESGSESEVGAYLALKSTPPALEPVVEHEGSISTIIKKKPHIDLSSIQLNQTQVNELCENVAERDDIHSVDVRNGKLDDQSIRKLTDSILQTPSEVKMLNFNLNRITPEGAKHVATILKERPKIQVLLLHGNPLGDAGVKEIIAAVEHLKTASEPKPMSPSSEAGSVVSTRSTESEEGTPIRSTAKELVKDVMDDVMRSPSFQELHPGQKFELSHVDLGDTAMGDEGAEEVARMIALNTPLSTLNLTGNLNIKRNGWESLSNALKNNTNLKFLTVDYTMLGDEGVKVLAEGLEHNKTLRTLDLEGNFITNTGGEAIVRLLEKNTTIQDITLMPGNELSDDLHERIKAMLEARKSL